MKRKICTVCLEAIESENPDVLTMGPYGNPKYLCEDCAALFNCAATDRDYGNITEAMDRLTAKLSERNVDDKLTIDTVNELFADFAKRAKAIQAGEWDFEAEEATLLREMKAEPEDVPEELKETEEDRLLDEKERQTGEKFDRIMNWVMAGAIVLIAGVIIFRLFF